MNKKGFLGNIFIVFFIIFIIIAIWWGLNSQEYVVEEITECNDADGDLIEDLVCHDVIRCADKLKFLNEKGCEEFIE